MSDRRKAAGRVISRGVQMVARRVKSFKKRQHRTVVIPIAVVFGTVIGIALDELVMCLAIGVAIGVAICLLPSEDK